MKTNGPFVEAQMLIRYGFQTSAEELIAEINGASGGFTTVLDGLKAYMEHGLNLNLIADKFAKK
ncbi:hypothetical protein AQ505_05545 [Pedobacter sp. PACM 27299]|uniref:hypothetical protein n=1 Tax=Pedobacter sp. PACM 27299 TaxID=1727164 RepID=UPI000705D2CE|nr:hypothetical protein [Pedobacter sp. PACM 27299]ALL05004.1 hypothetical protein AQ505_05545 [Pedobacter sp. PACM 27299]